MLAAPKERQHLSHDGLHRLLRDEFKKIPDHRGKSAEIALSDALMSGFAVFALKAPSLFLFDEQRQADEPNLKSLFGMRRIPSDTQMRTILDEVDPEHLRPAFTSVFRQLQRGKALEPFVFFQNHYLLALDGTSYFSSEKIHCSACLEKKSRNGKIAYSHQMLGAALVHPDLREVIPVCPEPIIKQDGETKNDCERNATRRFLERFREEHPKLPVIVVEDALSSNAPHLVDLANNGCRFIIGIKPGSHGYLFEQMRIAIENGRVQTMTLFEENGPTRHYRWLEKASLNESNAEVLVTMLEYFEQPARGSNAFPRHFSWVTDLPVDKTTAPILTRGGRSRWHIENETFNTLKNQGYHFDHNFGHGHNHLSVVFALLMMLAFLVDQTTQLCDEMFQAVWEKLRTKKFLWERVRAAFACLQLPSMRALYEALLRNYKAPLPESADTS